MENTDFRQESIDLESPYDIDLVQNFLTPLGFDYTPEQVDYTMILVNLNGDLIGTGSYKGKILMFVVVSPKFRESTAFAQIVTHLSNLVLQHSRTCFVYTKPVFGPHFQSIGFDKLAVAEPLYVMLELGLYTMANYKEYLEENIPEKTGENIAAIAVNCNPFTNGHKYLIEKAASESDTVYLFVVSEDKSVFKFKDRWELIKKGIAHLDNVVMLESKSYVVSGATFPSYFLKHEDISNIERNQAELDVTVFAEHIVPTLGITKRYVGTENYCVTTATYNESMKRILPKYNVEVMEVTRKSMGMDCHNAPNYISASKVRAALKEDRLAEILEFIPESTREYLSSPAAEEVIARIKDSDGRH